MPTLQPEVSLRLGTCLQVWLFLRAGGYAGTGPMHTDLIYMHGSGCTSANGSSLCQREENTRSWIRTTPVWNDTAGTQPLNLVCYGHTGAVHTSTLQDIHDELCLPHLPNREPGKMATHAG